MTPTYYTDEHRLCRQADRKGQSPQVDVFTDRRAGMSFPTVNSPGYYSIWGLKDVVTHRDKLPLELLSEGIMEKTEDNRMTDQTSFFTHLCRNMRVMECKYVYADCSREFQSNEIEFGKYVNRMGVRNLGLYDASEFDGFKSSYAGFESARAPLDEYGRKGLLKYDPQSELGKEMRIIVPDDFSSSKPWEKFPAINAFNHVIMSYVISPFVKPQKNSARGRREGYG